MDANSSNGSIMLYLQHQDFTVKLGRVTNGINNSQLYLKALWSTAQKDINHSWHSRLYLVAYV